MEFHFDRYKELMATYRIKRSHMPGDDIADYDVVIKRLGTSYATVTYAVIKNTANLSTEDLAIICDSGNLCFGYRSLGNIITVYID